jgi:hypothetical protein
LRITPLAMAILGISSVSHAANCCCALIIRKGLNEVERLIRGGTAQQSAGLYYILVPSDYAQAPVTYQP